MRADDYLHVCEVCVCVYVGGGGVFLDSAEPDAHRIVAPLRVSLREGEKERGERESLYCIRL